MPKANAPGEIKRKLIIKADEEMNFKYGSTPEERSIEDYIYHGIVNLDKTSGPSSHEVTAWVKRLLKITIAGHGGTLEVSL